MPDNIQPQATRCAHEYLQEIQIDKFQYLARIQLEPKFHWAFIKHGGTSPSIAQPTPMTFGRRGLPSMERDPLG